MMSYTYQKTVAFNVQIGVEPPEITVSHPYTAAVYCTDELHWFRYKCSDLNLFTDRTVNPTANRAFHLTEVFA